MRKRIILLAMLTSICLAACGAKESTEITTDKESDKSSVEESKDTTQEESESANEEIKNEEIKEEEITADSDNNSSTEEDKSNLKSVNSDLSGKITDISSDFGSKLLLLADNKLFYDDVEILSFDEPISSIQAFTTVEFGDMVFAITEAGTLSCWEDSSSFGMDPELELFFTGLPYEEGKDFVVYTPWRDSMTVLSVTDSDAYLTKYNILDDKSVETVGTFPISEYTYWQDGEMMDAYSSPKQVMGLEAPLTMGGYDGYCLTNGNELYYISSYYFDASDRNDGKNATVEMKHRVSNVEHAYCSSYVLGTCEPVYSKVGDSEKLYTYVRGASIIDPDDNIEIAFVLPDGHAPDEVVDIYGYSENICVFEFSNGDIYYTGAVDQKNSGEYSMTKCEELTELNNQGKIKQICSPFAHDKALVYVLLEDNSVYQMRFE